MSAGAPDRRAARCACGALRLTAEGAPLFVALCSCGDCQRRTGSAFSLNAWWPENRVATEGASQPFRRVSEAGRWWENRFCPACGVTLWWTAEFQPGRVGVAAGCLADPDFPAPEIAVWDATRARWLDGVADLPRHPRQRS